jgi:hypothetical protein
LQWSECLRTARSSSQVDRMTYVAIHVQDG